MGVWDYDFTGCSAPFRNNVIIISKHDIILQKIREEITLILSYYLDLTEIAYSVTPKYIKALYINSLQCDSNIHHSSLYK